MFDSGKDFRKNISKKLQLFAPPIFGRFEEGAFSLKIHSSLRGFLDQTFQFWIWFRGRFATERGFRSQSAFQCAWWQENGATERTHLPLDALDGLLARLVAERFSQSIAILTTFDQLYGRFRIHYVA